MTKIQKTYRTLKRGACTIRFLSKQNRWELDAGLKLGHDKRYRRWFKTKEEALVKADKVNLKLKQCGVNGFKLSPSETLEAVNAFQRIGAYEVRLNEVIEFYETHHQLKGANMSVRDLINDRLQFLNDERIKGEGVSDRTLSDYKCRYYRLAEYVGDISLVDFSFEKHWVPLSRMLCSSARRYENHLRILFNYAVEKDYLKASPMIGKLSKAPKHKKPTILSEKQWRKLILTAVNTDHELDLLVYVVLTLYMGLRPESEVSNLNWGNINLETGKVFIGDDQTGKSILGRTLEMPTCAIELLNLCKRKTGPIIASRSAFNKRWLTLREKAGLIIKDELGEIIRNDWSHDVARHTAATMLYGKTQSKEQVKKFLGHTNSSTMRYYINHAESICDEAKSFYAFTIGDDKNKELIQGIF